jgi:dihydroneopterin aldolase
MVPRMIDDNGADDWTLAQALGLRRLLERAGGSSYRIRVGGLELPCRIGIHEHERHQPQRVRISVELDVLDPGSFAGADISKVLNYETIVGGIKAIIAEGHVELVETLAERIASLCLADPRSVGVHVSVDKLDVYREADGVGVAIQRRAAHR